MEKYLNIYTIFILQLKLHVEIEITVSDVNVTGTVTSFNTVWRPEVSRSRTLPFSRNRSTKQNTAHLTGA